MKRVLAFVLTLAMLFGLSVTAAAAGGSTTVGVGGPTDIGDVTVAVTEGAVINTYHIIVAWQNLNFEYVKGTRTWDPEDHDYTEAAGAWRDSRNTAVITVTNKSDVDITVTGSVVDRSDADGFTASVSNPTFDLDSYAGLPVGSPDSNSFTVTASVNGVEGAPSANGAVADVRVAIVKKA